MGSAPKPNLVKSTALAKAQGLFSRINSLLPNYSTPISPVTVYQPTPAGGLGNVGNELLAAPTGGTTNALWGVWVAPDLNSGAAYQVQVECFAGGGGGGGGNTNSGGGGGGGGEYAAEPGYTVTPGLPYIWIRGIGGQGGSANSNSQLAEAGGAFNGGDTIFDLASTGIPGGIHAHGGQPGDTLAAGQGGTGGSGSVNTIASAGGAGATNNSAFASDNPQSFLAVPSGLWTHQPSSISCWLPMDDIGFGSGGNIQVGINNAQVPNNNGMADLTDFSGGLYAQNTANESSPLATAPTQAPTQTNILGNNSQGPNPTWYGGCVQWQIGKLSSPSARLSCQSFGFSGASVMMSGWIQCDPSGVWGSPGNLNTTIAANCAYPNANVPGMGLFIRNSGTAGNPVWQLGLYCGQNSSNKSTILAPANAIPPVPGTWYYVVGVFNAGTMTLYVNSTSVKTAAAGFSTVGGGAYPMTLGLRPDASTAQYFGFMSNFWFAQGVPTTTLLTTAFGSTPPTGGAGGGASGGASTGSAPFTNGGAGVEASGVSFGAGGSPPTPAAVVASIATSGSGGGNGSNQHTNKGGTLTIPGAGGGGCGTSVSVVPTTTLTETITTAASYNGTDGSNPGALYSPNQQGTGSTLVAGGQAADPVTGSKNSILLLPPGLKAALASPKTIVDCYLTVYSANPSNTITPVLEINYSADSSLPTNYEQSAAYSSISQVAPYILQSQTAAQEISLMNTGFTAALQSGAATALVLGPGGTAASPPNTALDAYNAPAANYFYSSIYGPGSTDAFGNSLAPTLTILYTATAPFQGQTGGGGEIAVTVINNAGIPVATIEPYQTVDADGNTLGAGFTGPIANWQPNLAAGAFTPEVWHPLLPYMNPQWGVTINFVAGFMLTAEGNLRLAGRLTVGPTGPAATFATLPTGYFNAALGSQTLAVPFVLLSGSGGSLNQRLLMNNAGAISVGGVTLAVGNQISLDGVEFPLSSIVPLYG